MTTPADKSPDPTSPAKATEPLAKPVPSGQTPSNFESYMQGAAKTPEGAPPTQQPTGPTPMSMAQNAQGVPPSAVTYNTLLSQASQVQDSLGTVGKQLNDKRLKLNRSQNHLVKQKLSDAGSHIRASGSKLGLDMGEEPSTVGVSTLGKFIAMVNHGQDQLGEVQEQLQKMSATGANVNPADMLSVQVKMGLAQQEIQYTSTLLGKVIQSITQLLSTQL